MAPFEIMAIALLTVFAYFHSKSLGLHGAIPPPGPTRTNYHGQVLLNLLKDELRQAQPVQVDARELVYQKGPRRCRMFVHECTLRLQVEQERPRDLFPMGERGRVTFQRVGEHMLQLDLVCEAEPEHIYQASLRLPLQGSLRAEA